MYIKRFFSCLLLLTVSLISCTTLEVGIETTPMSNPIAVDTAVTESVQATVQANETIPTVTEPTASIEPIATPSEPLQPSISPQFTGLIYRLDDQLFQVGPNGEPVVLAPGLDPQILPGLYTPRAAVSPDGKQMLSWWDWSDLWLVNFTSGEAHNLTNTPESQECCAQFWPGHEDTIIFLTRSADADQMSYKMAAVNLDGSNYHFVDESASLMGLPAISPDGNSIAYDPAGRPWLYRWDSGPESFNPADYGLQTSEESYGLTNPFWSPTGKYLGWMVSGDPFGNGTPQGGAIVFDLIGKTSRLLHPYEPAGTGGGFLPGVWSPDGNWLVVFDQSLNQPGVWVMHPDGSGEVLVYSPGSVRSIFGLQALWSPDAQTLLVIDPNAEGGIRLTLHNLLTNDTETAPLPVGAIPLVWK